MVAARQSLRVFSGEPDPKVGTSFGVASTLVASCDVYRTREMYDGDLDDGDWYLNDFASTPRGAIVVRTHKVRAHFSKVAKARRETGLPVSNTASGVVSQSTEAPVAVATSSALTSSLGASILYSQNDLLRAILSRTQRLL